MFAIIRQQYLSRFFRR